MVNNNINKIKMLEKFHEWGVSGKGFHKWSGDGVSSIKYKMIVKNKFIYVFVL